MRIVAVAFAVVFVGATLPSPLYPLYSRVFGFSGFMLTLVYAVYVLGNLAALLVFGRLSDQIGRRAVALPAIIIGIASTLAFLFADATVWLFVARSLSGLATGLAAGALTAWIAELEPHGDKTAAAVTASAANFAGCAAGPAIAGVLAVFAPQPLRLPYAVYIVGLASIGIMVLRPRETAPQQIARLRDLALAPRIGIPKRLRAAFAAPAVTAFATFALLGFYSALIPGLLADGLRQTSPLVAGGVIAELFLVSAVAIVLTARVRSRLAMLGGLTLLLPSLALLIAAELVRSFGILIAATALAGAAAALGYRGSLNVVNEIAPCEQRAELVSSYLVAVYAGNSLPVIGIGLIADLATPTTAHLAFAGLIAGLAATALTTAAGPRGKERKSTAGSKPAAWAPR